MIKKVVIREVYEVKLVMKYLKIKQKYKKILLKNPLLRRSVIIIMFVKTKLIPQPLLLKREGVLKSSSLCKREILPGIPSELESLPSVKQIVKELLMSLNRKKELR